MTEFSLGRVGCGILLPDCIGEDVREKETVGSEVICDTETATSRELQILQADREGCRAVQYLSKTPGACTLGEGQGEYQWQCWSYHQTSIVT